MLRLICIVMFSYWVAETLTRLFFIFGIYNIVIGIGFKIPYWMMFFVFFAITGGILWHQRARLSGIGNKLIAMPRMGQIHFIALIILFSLLGVIIEISSMIFQLAYVLFFMWCVVCRLKDMNSKWYWALLMVLPIVNLFFLIFLLFCPGTRGNNVYGEQPQPASFIITLFIILAVLLCVGLIVSVFQLLPH